MEFLDDSPRGDEVASPGSDDLDDEPSDDFSEDGAAAAPRPSFEDDPLEGELSPVFSSPCDELDDPFPEPDGDKR